jgi:hypothetical protein
VVQVQDAEGFEGGAELEGFEGALDEESFDERPEGEVGEALLVSGGRGMAGGGGAGGAGVGVGVEGVT